MIDFLKRIEKKTINQPGSFLPKLIASKQKQIVLYLNAHNLILAFFYKEFRHFLQKADYFYADGFGAVIALKILGKVNIKKYTAPSFFDFFCEFLSNQRIFLLGSKQDKLQPIVRLLKSKKLAFSQVDSYHGYFSKQEEQKVIKKINQFKPDILLVGMGSGGLYDLPKQEEWIIKNQDKIFYPCLIWCVGGFFENYPRKNSPFLHYCEWIYRSLKEPSRLGLRYFFDSFNIFIVYGYLIFYRILRKLSRVKLNKSSIFSQSS